VVKKENRYRLVGWNGLRMTVPANWETRVDGHRRLLFEKAFEPLLQVRWEQAGKYGLKKLPHRLKGLFPPPDHPIPEKELSSCWKSLGRQVTGLSCYGRSGNRIRGGFWVCGHCGTVVLFQCLEEKSAEMIATSLGTLLCHGEESTLWRVQDFSLTTPADFALRSYTFAAGLTRLSLTSAIQQLDTCRLAGADQRLARQTLPAILQTLAGAEDLQLSSDDLGTRCDGIRSPTILGQIRLRLRRVQPFIRARIRHDLETNRLLALVLGSKRPIPSNDLDILDRAYETLSPENHTPVDNQNGSPGLHSSTRTIVDLENQRER
jgi:hypothetical protein